MLGAREIKTGHNPVFSTANDVLVYPAMVAEWSKTLISQIQVDDNVA